VPIESASSKVMKQRNVRCYREDAPGSRWHTASRRGTIAMATLASRAARPISSGRTRPPSSASTSRLVAPGPAFRARAGPRVSASAALADTSSPASSSASDVELAKRALLRAVDGTCRGCVASPAELAEAARAQATLENLAGGDLDLEKLSGKWRMVYTTAGDVLSVLRLGRDTGAVEVGDIYQSFDARGNIQNEIRLSVPLLLVPASQVRARRATEPARSEPAPRDDLLRRLHFDPDPTHPLLADESLRAPMVAWRSRLRRSTTSARLARSRSSFARRG